MPASSLPPRSVSAVRSPRFQCLFSKRGITLITLLFSSSIPEGYHTASFIYRLAYYSVYKYEFPRYDESKDRK